MLIAAGLVTSLSEVLLVAANAVTKPAESRIRHHYLTLARREAAAVHPVVVAVVGSYGKTSTKHILAQLLQPKVNTLPTRKSFNTLMGVSRAINEDLSRASRVRRGDGCVRAGGDRGDQRARAPAVAIVTAIGPQHMERFGSLDRIADALHEVLSALPADGTAILHTGDAPCEALAQRAAPSTPRSGMRSTDDRNGRCGCRGVVDPGRR